MPGHIQYNPRSETDFHAVARAPYSWDSLETARYVRHTAGIHWNQSGDMVPRIGTISPSTRDARCAVLTTQPWGYGADNPTWGYGSDSSPQTTTSASVDNNVCQLAGQLRLALSDERAHECYTALPLWHFISRTILDDAMDRAPYSCI
eukprot:gene15563-21660_t